VADSEPKTEWLETCSKARGMLLALRVSQQAGGQQPGGQQAGGEQASRP